MPAGTRSSSSLGGDQADRSTRSTPSSEATIGQMSSRVEMISKSASTSAISLPLLSTSASTSWASDRSIMPRLTNSSMTWWLSIA